MNEAHNRRRWFGRHKRQEVDLERDDSLAGLSLQDTLPDSGSSPFELALSVEAQKLIEEALQALSPAFREAVVLRDVEELSYEEIADVLGINIGTVKSRILRGRDALRKEVSNRMAETGRMEELAPPDLRAVPAWPPYSIGCCRAYEQLLPVEYQATKGQGILFYDLQHDSESVLGVPG